MKFGVNLVMDFVPLLFPGLERGRCVGVGVGRLRCLCMGVPTARAAPFIRFDRRMTSPPHHTPLLRDYALTASSSRYFRIRM